MARKRPMSRARSRDIQVPAQIQQVNGREVVTPSNKASRLSPEFVVESFAHHLQIHSNRLHERTHEGNCTSRNSNGLTNTSLAPRFDQAHSTSVAMESWRDPKTGLPRELGDAWVLVKGPECARCTLQGHQRGINALLLLNEEVERT